jgi:gas vesicle structural protein
MHNQAMQSKDVTLLEVLDRVLEKGVVVAGDAVIAVADVDLIYVGLRVLLSSVETMERLRSGERNAPACNAERSTAGRECRMQNAECKNQEPGTKNEELRM